MKIGLCGDFELTGLATALDRRHPTHEFSVGAPQAWSAELTTPFGDFCTLDLCILIPNGEDHLDPLYHWGFGDDPTPITALIDQYIEKLHAAITGLRSATPARIILAAPLSLARSATGALDRTCANSSVALFRSLNTAFDRLVQSIPDCFVLDLSHLANDFGHSRIYNQSNAIPLETRFSTGFFEKITNDLSALITRIDEGPIKAIVVDLDNTLWGGIVGEGDGAIELGTTPRGAAFVAFQKRLLQYYKQGVILAIASKNNTCDVFEVMENHPAMVLKPSHFSAFRINWSDKPTNIVEIAHELNIDLSAILFLDDSPMERELVSATLPAVIVPMLSDDPSTYITLLDSTPRLRPLTLTKEDIDKGRFFAENRLRATDRALAASVVEYLHAANISVNIHEATSAEYPRLSQLFGKTNQFNLTTRRLTESDMTTLAKTPHTTIHSLTLTDRHGDYGLIAAAILQKETITDFALSCRAFGRGVERAFASYLIGVIKNKGYPTAIGLWNRSFKNSMTKDFYTGLGFLPVSGKCSEEQGAWQIDLTGEIPATALG